MLFLFIFLSICEASLCSTHIYHKCSPRSECNSYCGKILHATGLCQWNEHSNTCECICNQKVTINELTKNISQIKIIHENFCINITNECKCKSVDINKCLTCIDNIAPQCKHIIENNNDGILISLTNDSCNQIYCQYGSATICCPTGHEAVCQCLGGVGHCYCG